MALGREELVLVEILYIYSLFAKDKTCIVKIYGCETVSKAESLVMEITKIYCFETVWEQNYSSLVGGCRFILVA